MIIFLFSQQHLSDKVELDGHETQSRCLSAFVDNKGALRS
jgi:hypothetical protein